MKISTIAIVLSSTLLLFGCQAIPTPEPEVPAPVEGEAEQPADLATALLEPNHPLPPENLWDRVRPQITFNSIDNERVASARQHYMRQRAYLEVVAKRAEPYLFYIVGEVERRGMPIEIALLPAVESTFSPFAYSSEHASGLWQIMPGTGKQLGLSTNWWYDGRRDLRASTGAALDYLEQLHSDLGDDWLLALAAYNAGKTRVRRAQRDNRNKGLPTDYWSLRLPRETRHYVPRLIALSSLLAHPEAWSLDVPPIPNRPAFEVVDTQGQIELARAASLAGVEPRDLHALNAGQLRWATSPEQAPELLVPHGAGTRLAEEVAKLGPQERVRWQHYKIANGDSLSGIAHRFDTQVSLLREVNHLKGSFIRAGDTLMIPQGDGWASSLAQKGAPAQPKRRGYRVRQGDSLYVIANRFNVSVRDLVAWNSLNPKAYLQPGQKLTLYPGET